MNGEDYWFTDFEKLVHNILMRYLLYWSNFASQKLYVSKQQK